MSEQVVKELDEIAQTMDAIKSLNFNIYGGLVNKLNCDQPTTNLINNTLNYMTFSVTAKVVKKTLQNLNI
jgi:hypothetical protein